MNISGLRKNAEQLLKAAPNLRPAIRPFFDILSFVVEKQYRGACHATSSIYYVLLSELKIDATICIGELGRGEICFDHSWIEIGGKIFDISVARSLEPRLDSPPIFLSRELANFGEPYWHYGTSSGFGDDPFVQLIKAGSFVSYMDNAPFHEDGLWHFVQKFGRHCGLEIELEEARNKYASVSLKAKYRF